MRPSSPRENLFSKAIRSASTMDRFAHLDWPFFEPRHAELARRADAWAASNLGYAHDADEDSVCRRLVKDLGAAGVLAHCAARELRLDVRAPAGARQVRALHPRLARISLFPP